MNFFRAFVLPTSTSDITTSKLFRFGASANASDSLAFIEEVSIASGPLDFPLYFDGPVNIFVKRLRFSLPNCNLAKSFTSSTFMVVPPVASDFIDIALASRDLTLNPFPSNPLRIRSTSQHGFAINEWIDVNDFLKLDTLAPSVGAQNRIRLNTTQLSVDFGTAFATVDTRYARLELEFYSNKETHR